MNEIIEYVQQEFDEVLEEWVDLRTHHIFFIVNAATKAMKRRNKHRLFRIIRREIYEIPLRRF